jgi:hypothetical protein
MPIRPEHRHYYRGAAWAETRRRILARAGYRCEQCGKRDGSDVQVYSTGSCGQVWRAGQRRNPKWISCLTGKPISLRLFAAERIRTIRVVLTIAHLNHTPGDDRDENLKALCPWCHLHYDSEQHADTRRARKDAARPLLATASTGRA